MTERRNGRGEPHHLRLLLGVLLGDNGRAGFEGLVRLLDDEQFADLDLAVTAERIERHRRLVREGEHVLEEAVR